MASKELIDAVSSYEEYIRVNGITEEVINAYVMASQTAYAVEKDIEYGMKVSSRAKELIRELVKTLTGADFETLEEYALANKQKYEIIETYYKVLLLEAPHLLDSYLLYLEKNRDWKDRFYQPRRKCLVRIGLIQALQDIEDDKLDVLSISLPPGTGKTTIEKFFTTWVIGRHLEEFNLFFSHSGDITRMFYDGINDITTNTEEYTFLEIFPDAQQTGTNAKTEQLNYGKYKPFSSIQCTSVGAKNAGKVRASKYLLCDDMIGGIEEALNKNTLDKLWNIYAVDARQRKIDGCKEIHIATRWSVHDVIGRLQLMYEGNPRAKFIAYPDIDPETGESNFLYDVNGFSVEFYHEQELAMDDVSYKCLYKNEPIEREGLLYHDDELRRYVSLPDREPDAILSVCDTKTTGVDFMVLPVFYQYDEDYYLVDCVCNDSADIGTQNGRLATMLLNYNVQQCEFESNAGGSRLAFEVDEIIKRANGRCNITTKATETNKETRIIVNSDWIKKRCLFRVKENYGIKTDYSKFMNFLVTYSVAGKNKYDDVPDAMANFALFITNKCRVNHVEAVFNPFRSRGY